jgi:hypothetical protein
MLKSFKALRFGLIVVIGEGIRDIDNSVDIRLGDVVVSQPTGTNSSVIQYNKGKCLTGGKFHYKGTLNATPSAPLRVLNFLQSE